MKTFAVKIKEARKEIGLTQPALAEMAGVSLSSIQLYEMGRRHPRRETLFDLAAVLKVSFKYLSDDSCEDPREEIENDSYLRTVQKRYGTRVSRGIQKLVRQSTTLFSGGVLPESDIDVFFEALTEAYIACMREASTRFGRKKAV